MMGNAPCMHVDAEFCEKCWPPKDKPALTLGEARKMTYEQLTKACDVFNNHGLSGEDIQKAWDNNWWSGFDAAIDMVLNHLDNTEEIEGFRICLKENILEEVELYKKDG